ncbi:sodium bile acid cotransporter [Plakobranchus ocellatus]|uniref:Sodium bile acid cotransporter n=1 Tax=Plakobranchus ocellatus TaxID=259542 RepID=A0AAV3YYD2_9GAST|nr:sodium bile acid cotransporter [Plakobranchus ocellatus]
MNEGIGGSETSLNFQSQMAFGLAMLLPLVKDIRFGLLCVACVPGGGLGHVAVVIAEGDVALSMTLNFISAIAMLVTAPLWIFILGQYFHGDPETVLSSHSVPVFYFEIWLAASFLAYWAGLIIKRLKPLVADAILMWLIKPFLLLASILYITLGVYINMYVFELVNEYALLGAMLLPFCGCLVGALAAAAFRQSYAFVKTIALETSSLNCLIVMVALRYTLEQPDADLAAMIPIWVMFTIPGLYASLAICNKIKNVIRHYWDNRNGNKKEGDGCAASKAYSVSSSVVSPPGTTTLSAPLVVADGGLDDDLTISTMSNQKVTVL